MYYDLDTLNMEAELGIVIGEREYWGNTYGYDAVVTLLDYTFSQKNLKRVYLHTLDWNKRAQRCFARCGFTSVKIVRRFSQDFLLMEVRREDWQARAAERLEARSAYRDTQASAPATEQHPPSAFSR
jgi:RimJ/RimL family protein N-acetyltransferase